MLVLTAALHVLVALPASAEEPPVPLPQPVSDLWVKGPGAGTCCEQLRRREARATRGRSQPAATGCA